MFCYNPDMNGTELYELYSNLILPQFGLKEQAVIWDSSDTLGPDEEAHYFNIRDKRYVLIFEDVGGLAVERNYIKDNIELKGKDFTYISPVSATDHPPSWLMGLTAPYKYCHNVTGAFTLLLLDQ